MNEIVLNAMAVISVMLAALVGILLYLQDKDLRKKRSGTLFLPNEPYSKKIIDSISSAHIADGGIEATGDVSLEAQNKPKQHTQEEREAFLKKCGIDPKAFFNA